MMSGVINDLDPKTLPLAADSVIGFDSVTGAAIRMANNVLNPALFAPISSIPVSPPQRGGDATFGVSGGIGFPTHVPQPLKVRRARLRVAVQSGQLCAALYGVDRARLVTSAAVECAPTGAMEIALPPTTIPAGVVSAWLSTSDGTASVGVQSTYGDVVGGERMTASAHPLPATLSALSPSTASPVLVFLPDDPTPLATATTYARTDMGIAVMGKNPSGGRLYGVNTTNGHWAHSDDDGATWVDDSVSPSAGNPSSGLIGLVFHGADWYAYTNAGKVFKNTIGAYTGWTEVTPSGLPVGTIGRPDCLVSNGTYLYYTNYNQYVGAAPGPGAGVWRSTDGASWTQTGTAATAKHGHAVYVDPTASTTIWWSVGDAGFTGCGLWVSTDSGATFTQVSSNAYGIDIVRPATVSGVPARMILEGDGSNTPHLYSYLATQTTGTHLTDPLIWHDTNPADGGGNWRGTTRGLALTTEANAIYITTNEGGAVGTRNGIWLARGPWYTTPVLLEDLGATPWAGLGKTYISGGYALNWKYRMRLPKFAGQ